LNVKEGEGARAGNCEAKGTFETKPKDGQQESERTNPFLLLK
jgi:hypothetical protein